MTVTKQLEELRAHADDLGLKYHHRAGATKLQGLINDHLVKQHNTPNETPISNPVPNARKVPTQPVLPMATGLFKRQQAASARRKVAALVRIRCQNMNHIKKDWNGEFISVGSAKLGTYKKFIPFDGEVYHVPQIIFDVMKDKRCSQFYNAKDERGQSVRKSRLIPEYAIEVLPRLSPVELQELAAQQALAAGSGA